MPPKGNDARGDYQNGGLQDIHWSRDSAGYFPGYTLGALRLWLWAAWSLDLYRFPWVREIFIDFIQAKPWRIGWARGPKV